MFVDFAADPPLPRGRRWTDLPDDEALILWALRRIVVAWPRCHVVHAALHRRFGDDALGVEHLLRCWLTGLARHATRPLTIGDPACAMLLADEVAMLAALRAARGSAGAPDALDGLCSRDASPVLAPVAAALACLISA